MAGPNRGMAGPNRDHGGPSKLGPYRCCVQSVVRWGYLDRWPATIVEMTIAHRLRGFDYSSDGSYLVTICTHRRLPILTDDCQPGDKISSRRKSRIMKKLVLFTCAVAALVP